MTDDMHSETVLSIHNRQLNVGTNSICDWLHAQTSTRSSQTESKNTGWRWLRIHTSNWGACGSQWLLGRKWVFHGDVVTRVYQALVVGSRLMHILDHKWTLCGPKQKGRHMPLGQNWGWNGYRGKIEGVGIVDGCDQNTLYSCVNISVNKDHTKWPHWLHYRKGKRNQHMHNSKYITQHK